MSKFNHDCEHCIYLGSFTWGESGITRQVDYYICNDSVLARFGDEPSDYSSGPLNFLSPLNGHLLTAATLAVQKGHVSFDAIDLTWIRNL